MQNSLRDLKPGESGVITTINAKGAIKRRLMDMGVISGSEIHLEKVAPLGDPIEVKIKGYNLSLRKEDAKNIFVK